VRCCPPHPRASVGHASSRSSSAIGRGARNTRAASARSAAKPRNAHATALLSLLARATGAVPTRVLPNALGSRQNRASPARDKPCEKWTLTNFPDGGKFFPVPIRKFPAPRLRELAVDTRGISGLSARGSSLAGRKIKKFPVFSRETGNSRSQAPKGGLTGRRPAPDYEAQHRTGLYIGGNDAIAPSYTAPSYAAHASLRIQRTTSSIVVSPSMTASSPASKIGRIPSAIAARSSAP
jgi:hypothetical protein